MLYNELPTQWQRIFELEWESLCMGSKAIAAVITDENGGIISEARNMTGESHIPNPKTAHAETEAVRNLDIDCYPNKWNYTLYSGLEPCVMCMGTLVMGGIRKVEIAARDDFGGAIDLLTANDFLKNKNVQVVWHGELLGDIQRGLQTMRELLFNTDRDKLGRMLKDFSVYNKRGVDAAIKLVDDGFFDGKQPAYYTAEEAVNEILNLISD